MLALPRTGTVPLEIVEATKDQPKYHFIIYFNDMEKQIGPRCGQEEIFNMTLTYRVFPGRGQFALVPSSDAWSGSDVTDTNFWKS